MKFTYYLYATILWVGIVLPCSACFEMEGEGPVLTLKCSIEGFHAYGPVEQIARLTDDMTNTVVMQSEPLELPDDADAEKHEALFLSNSLGSSPVLQENSPIKVMGDTGLSTLDLHYTPEMRRNDLCDFYPSPLGFYMFAVRDPEEHRNCLLFFRLLGLVGRTTPNVEWFSHTNFLLWNLVSSNDDPLSNTYISLVMKEDGVKLAQFNIYTTTPNPTPEFVNMVRAAIGMIIDNLSRPTRPHKITNFQFEVFDDNALMKAVIKSIGLRNSQRRLGIGVVCPKTKKRNYIQLTDGVGQIYYRYSKTFEDPREYQQWFRSETDSNE